MKSISEDAMTNEIQFLIEMRQFPLYAGFPNLQTSIFLQDDLDDRFTHNDYIDLLASTLLYHQIVENMLQSLMTQYYYLEKFNLYPHSKKEVEIPNGFWEKLNLLKDLEDRFDCKKEFIRKCSWLNKLRNDLAHKFIHMNREELISKMNTTKKVYHRIRDIYASNTFRIYNQVQSQSKNYMDYICYKKDYSIDITEIGDIIKRDWDGFYYEDYGIYISLYVFLYNRKNPEDIRKISWMPIIF